MQITRTIHILYTLMTAFYRLRARTVNVNALQPIKSFSDLELLGFCDFLG
jgi:hypothetical protein